MDESALFIIIIVMDLNSYQCSFLIISSNTTKNLHVPPKWNAF